jgi:hypothetical protein
VILRKYDGQQQPAWRGVSLNTVLSWLSTAAKACIALPLTSALSQLKWVWFAKRARPLSDLKVFDNASRGVYGSVELVWALRMRYVSNFCFVSLSCLHVILMSEGEGILRSWVRLQSC